MLTDGSCCPTKSTLRSVGEIRTRLIRYRSKLETSEDYFPKIESARDSLGNIAGGGAFLGDLSATDTEAG